MQLRFVLECFQNQSGSSRVNRLYPFDFSNDSIELSGVANAHSHDVAIFAGDAMEFLDFRNLGEVCRGFGGVKLSPNENKSNKGGLFHNSPSTYQDFEPGSNQRPQLVGPSMRAAFLHLREMRLHQITETLDRLLDRLRAC